MPYNDLVYRPRGNRQQAAYPQTRGQQDLQPSYMGGGGGRGIMGYVPPASGYRNDFLDYSQQGNPGPMVNGDGLARPGGPAPRLQLEGSGPYGGQPLSRQGGQLTDYGAGQINRASRDYLGQNYMPRTTVGGAYGQGGGPIPGSAEYEADVSRRIGMARQGNFREAQVGNMNGGILGAQAHSSYGATSGNVIDSTGRPRPGWVSNYSGNTGSIGQQDVQRGLAGISALPGRVVSPTGSMTLSPGSAQYEATQSAGEVFDARRGGLQARIADYEARTQDMAQFRQGNRIARGMQRGQRMTDSLDMRRGNLSMDERFMFGNPQAYARTVEARNLGAYQQGLLGVQDRATQARERMAGGENTTRLGIAGIAAATRKGDQETELAKTTAQNASNERVTGMQGTNTQAVAGIQAKGLLDAAIAQRDPMNQQKFNIEAMAKIAEIAKVNPALARAMASQLPGMGGMEGNAQGTTFDALTGRPEMMSGDHAQSLAGMNGDPNQIHRYLTETMRLAPDSPEYLQMLNQYAPQSLMNRINPFGTYRSSQNLNAGINSRTTGLTLDQTGRPRMGLLGTIGTMGTYTDPGAVPGTPAWAAMQQQLGPNATFDQISAALTQQEQQEFNQLRGGKRGAY